MKKIFSKFRTENADNISPVAGKAQLDRVEKIIASADQVHNNAFLAFTGDKRFLLSESGRSFIMFGIKGRAWVAVGPAIGQVDEVEQLEVQFIAKARASRAFPSFYGVTLHDVQRLEKAGLVREKLGEKASLGLQDYTFSGRGKRDIRSARNKAVDAGCRFEILDARAAQGLHSQLKAISDNWLLSNASLEKKFSLGRFDADYLKSFHIAVVFKDEQPIAFANLWVKDAVVVIDMMRYTSPAQSGLMDYLFMEVILWAQGRGLLRFDMGAAPLSGLAEQESPSTVAKLGALIFVRGGKFYNFTGIKKYKNKFDPDWEPLFICAKSSLRAGAAAMAVASLTGMGMRQKLRLPTLKLPR